MRTDASGYSDGSTAWAGIPRADGRLGVDHHMLRDGACVALDLVGASAECA